MSLTQNDRRLLTRATELALEWHAEHFRKGTTTPYVSHLLQVEGLVIEHGGGVDQAVAALLHDSLEDADTPPERARRERLIAAEFPEAVLATVLVCTDTQEDETIDAKRPWRERKERYLEQLRRTDDASLLVAACDKHHNLHSIVWDVRSQGVEYLDRFTGRPADQRWYFREVLAIVRDRVPERLQLELEDLLRQFEAQVDSC